ncbi:FMN-binding negative transcriptional regulator [Paraglaciecola hydrolytica]|uniref:Transcriptional regulator n=1 Tax=Paraglaciecola hydrolytica TaxID=1799789 RepID=A0A136A3E6_9ALTE|nr:FMN-binding negative transcriptional regulator [Paraglaciecola hydrolytica]KXI29734.1 transcriptional regulator [Paraglaciecola hydrolytica]
MYVPRNMQMENAEHYHTLIEDFGFGVLITQDLQVSHLPVYLVKDEGEKGVLYGHMARANPHWKALNSQQVKVIFNGPHSYISPSWYAVGPAVPTWNYAAVHVTGRATLLNDEQTLAAVHALVKQYEPALLDNEALMPADYQHKLAKAIVGFKIEITQIEGKQKLGQHKSIADQQGTVIGLERSKHPEAIALLAYMQQTGIGLGKA